MDITLIEQYICEFRSALDAVVDKRQYGRLTLFAHFPYECCGYTSDLLAEYLMQKGVARERIQFVDGESNREEYTHCWLMLDNEIYIDVTADQFNDKPYFSQYQPIPKCCIVQRGTYLYKCFENSKIRYLYDVGIQSRDAGDAAKLQEIYDKIVDKIESAP